MAGVSPGVTAIPLGRPSPGVSSNQPERQGQRKAPRGFDPTHRSYSVLLPAGLAVPPTLPPARCALTAPFHPYPASLAAPGGLLSVALSLGLPPPDVIRRRFRMEPGLSSARRRRPSSRLAARGIGGAARRGQAEKAWPNPSLRRAIHRAMRNLWNFLIHCSFRESMGEGRRCRRGVRLRRSPGTAGTDFRARGLLEERIP